MASVFKGSSVWITGGGSGLGRAMALEFARLGAQVAISGRREDRLQAVVNEISELGAEGLAIPCDCTEEVQIKDAVAEVMRRFGSLHVAIANAGFAVSGPIARLSADDWRRQLDVNVVGVALTARHTIPHLKVTKGRLALVGSVSGLAYFPRQGAYSASKAAVLAMGRTLAMELAPDGVSCTVLQPGFVDTEIARVDNHGRMDPRRSDPRPKALMWDADIAARRMIRAIARRQVEYTFTNHGRIGAFLGRHAPGLLQLVGRQLALRRRKED